ncbi:hypothetical protein LCGC14_0821860 [marine sediment metagenome]|uniref:DUF4815 domain-containing protein n=1 Tax=marine sediment metagenome TaxID=412755 RepID=A0A0F9Q3T9_9ZZZZ
MLYATRDIVISSTTAASTSLTALTDSVLAPAAQSQDYVRAYINISTQPTKVDSTSNTAEALDATETDVDVDTGTDFTVNDGIQVDSEIMRVTAIVSNTLTVVRGIQGTTAATHDTATDVFIIGSAIGEVARVTNISFSGSNSDLTIKPALSCRLVSGQEYEIHYMLHPSKPNNAINTVLDTLQHPIHLPATKVADGDMRASGTTDWTAAGTGGTPTLAKETTIVRHGEQSLSITNGGSTTRGFAKSASMNIPGGTQVLVSVDVFITAGDSVKISLIDVTNSDAKIDTATSAITGWVTLYFTVQTPATCEQVQIWLEAPAVSDVVYFDHAIVWPTKDLLIDPISTVEYGFEVEKVVYFPRGRGLSATGDDNAYAIEGKEPVFYSHFEVDRDDSDVTPNRIQLTTVDKVMQPLWLKAWVDYATMSADTDTTFANKDLVLNLSTADLLDNLALAAEMDEKSNFAERMTLRAIELRQEIFHLTREFTREPKGRIDGAMR